jgi:hypothetical protein
MQLGEFLGTTQLFSELDLADLFFNRHGSARLLCKAKPRCAGLMLASLSLVDQIHFRLLRVIRAGHAAASYPFSVEKSGSAASLARRTSTESMAGK